MANISNAQRNNILKNACTHAERTRQRNSSKARRTHVTLTPATNPKDAATMETLAILTFTTIGYTAGLLIRTLPTPRPFRGKTGRHAK